MLVLDPVSIGGRRPYLVDPIEAAVARGTFVAPREGMTVLGPDGKDRRWHRIRRGERGEFRDPALRGGWAFFSFEASEAGAALLAVRGPRHLYWNGEPRVGDLYDLGLTSLPVPVREGRNEVLLRAGRGRIRLELRLPDGELTALAAGAVLPDLVTAEDRSPFSLLLAHAGPMVESIRVGIGAGGEATGRPGLPPFALVGLRGRTPAGAPGAEPGRRFVVTIDAGEDGGTARRLLELQVVVPGKAPADPRRCTFVSAIDGSVQYYGLRPPSGDLGARHGLILTLHGASVAADHQARCYGAKDWAWIVAPTNRRRYGFDWEDWGRLDAVEVLEDALQRLVVDERRVLLTGHSMGGHGTWILGAQFPDRFAAIAPSAGWRDFWSYGGAHEGGEGAVAALLDRAANASRTLLLQANWARQGVYVLHGDADETVPVAEARAQRERLARFHADFAYYERPGAGHWWGNACMDWPPLMAFLERHRLMPPEARDLVEFTTVAPRISDRCDWVRIAEQGRSHEPSRIRVQLRWKDALVRVETSNVGCFALDLGAVVARHVSEDLEAGIRSPAEPELSVRIDEQEPIQLRRDWGRAPLRLARVDGRWQALPEQRDGDAPRRKGEGLAGPFKEVFRNRVRLVYATRGSAEENAWAYNKARYDSETFWYRGNAVLDLIADVDLLAELDAGVQDDRNLVLYGNAETHAAWNRVLPERPPLRLHRGRLEVGARRLEGETQAVLACLPRRDSPNALVGIVGGTGLPGMRATTQLPYFVSGIHYPDWTVLDVAMLETGPTGILGCGYFDNDWSLGEDQAWQPDTGKR